MPSPIMKHFAYAHLPPHLQEVSRPIGDLAEKMDAELPDGAEKSAGLRKLLEAKDCLVRAKLEPAPQVVQSIDCSVDVEKVRALFHGDEPITAASMKTAFPGMR